MSRTDRLPVMVALTLCSTMGSPELICAQLGQGASDPVSIKQYLPELQRLQERRDWLALEILSRQALSAVQDSGRPDDLGLASAGIWLATALQQEARYAEAEPLCERAVATYERTLGADHASTAVGLNCLGEVLRLEGRYAEAELLFRKALANREKAGWGPHIDLAASLNNLASVLQDQGRYADAEPLYRRSLAIYEKELGPDHFDTATVLEDLGDLLRMEGRYVEAEPLMRRTLLIRARTLGPEHPDTAKALNSLEVLRVAQGRYTEAEPLLRRALAVDEKALGAESPITAVALDNLGELLRLEGHYAEAEELARRALQINESSLGPEHAGTASSLTTLALVLASQGRYAEAEPLYERALRILEKSLGKDHPETARVYEKIAFDNESQGKFDVASTNYRIACSARILVGQAQDQSLDAAASTRMQAGFCSTHLSLSLWGWSVAGGGLASGDGPRALRDEAFVAGQRSAESAAQYAMAHSAALSAASSAGVGTEARDYEAALLERDELDQQLAKAFGKTADPELSGPRSLAKARDKVISDIQRLESSLKTKAPRYWDYRSPEPLSIEALQTRLGPDSTLLHDEEALIAFVVPSGNERGLVFAVSKDRASWAQLGLTGSELRERVSTLRGQIDPHGYEVRGVVQIPDASRSVDVNPGAFNRKEAYELYRALLGDASIQGVIRDKSVLLWVPSGPLIGFPPGMLITAPPVGDRAEDADPATLRATPWLLRSKAVALLPAVESLRTLRQLMRAAKAATSDPFLAFADPAFNLGVSPKLATTMTPIRGFSAYYRDGAPMADALADLPSLPGTRIEAQALQRALKARPDSVLVGRDASKAQLMARNADGRLALVRVLEFATHGLVAGDAAELAEPALVLAAGAQPADELLLASEASTLRLNADWVLLSACNTASPDTPEAQGLSGLSRAFFYAGAKSLLVSHWSVRDDVAEKLVPAMLLAEQNDPRLTHAQALQKASLEVLDDSSLDAAAPSAWAPFTLVGETGR